MAKKDEQPKQPKGNAASLVSYNQKHLEDPGQFPAPRSKIGKSEEEQIYVVLRLGGSLADAAAIILTSPETLKQRYQRDPSFAFRVDEAVAAGKMKVLAKLRKKDDWRAQAWWLERRFKNEWAEVEVDKLVEIERQRILLKTKAVLAAELMRLGISEHSASLVGAIDRAIDPQGADSIVIDMGDSDSPEQSETILSLEVTNNGQEQPKSNRQAGSRHKAGRR